MRLTNRKERVEYEKEYSCNHAIDSTEYWSVELIDGGCRACAGKDNHGRHHAECSKEHELAAADTLDQWYGDESSDEVFGAVRCSQKTRHIRTETQRVLEHESCIVCLRVVSISPLC